MHPKKFVLVAASVGLGWVSAFAAGELAYVVHQPIVAEEMDILPYPVTIAIFGDVWASPGWTVVNTLAENRILTRRGFENRNAANLAGLKVTLVPHAGPPENMVFPGLFGDTLRVLLDVSAAADTRAETEQGVLGYSLTSVLLATRECFQLNLRQEYPRIRFLDLTVVGSDEFAALGGVFPICPPPRLW